ncbi:hypothetical protein BGZ60DRAFT_421787 [Tricladium varicosporioides]|nr:hypothetical protein BGZ60DRAFT_421787 [Hymenoscyphus varicosporioides]
MTNNPKRKSQRLSRRKDTLLKKAYELAFFCDVDVAVVLRIRKKGHLITFNSTDSDSWPPSKDDIVSACPTCVEYYTNRATRSFTTHSR